MPKRAVGPWTSREWLVAALDRNGGYTGGKGGQLSGAVSRVAREAGCSQATISNWIIRHDITPDESRWNPGPPLVPVCSEVLRIEGDAACSADWHLPAMHYPTFHRWLEDAHARNLTTGICAGDLFNLDAWGRFDDKQATAGIPVEIEHAQHALGEALDVFDRFIVTLGNHDERVVKQLGYTVAFDHAFRMLASGLPAEKLARITITAKDAVIVDTDMGEWRICHTRQYSKLPLSVPNRLAMRYMQHIAAGHRHHHAQGFAGNGKMIVELGGFHDADRMAYLHKYSNDFPAWSRGYGLLIDGRMVCPML